MSRMGNHTVHLQSLDPYQWGYDAFISRASKTYWQDQLCDPLKGEDLEAWLLGWADAETIERSP